MSLFVCIAYRDWADAVQCAATAVIAWPLYRLTRRVTHDPTRPKRPRNTVAVGVIAALILVLTSIEQATPNARITELWGQLHWGLAGTIARAVGVHDLETVNAAVTFAAIPILCAIALGWRRTDLGAGPNATGTMKTLVLWTALPIVAYAVFIALGRATLPGVAQRMLVDVFRNGFAEEVFFRGIVLRVAASAGLKTGNVVQALCFGLWHFGADMRDVNGVPLLALADGMCTQAFFGYVLGLITQRTGNVLVAGVVHSLLDAARAVS